MRRGCTNERATKVGQLRASVAAQQMLRRWYGLNESMNAKRTGLWALLWLAGTIHVHAEEFRLESVGTRAGVSKQKNGYEFYQVEGFVNWNLPCRWDCY